MGSTNATSVLVCCPLTQQYITKRSNYSEILRMCSTFQAQSVSIRFKSNQIFNLSFKFCFLENLFLGEVDGVTVNFQTLEKPAMSGFKIGFFSRMTSGEMGDTTYHNYERIVSSVGRSLYTLSPLCQDFKTFYRVREGPWCFMQLH